MRTIRGAGAATLVGIAVLVSAAGAGSVPVLPSAWRVEPVTIDGRSDDWTALTPFEGAHLAVGVANDEKHFYLAVSSSDQAQRRQLAATGLLIWLDAGGGRKKSYGIRFPGVVGSRADRPGGMRRTPGAPRAEGEATEPSLPPLTWFELAGPREDDRRRLERSAVTSIQVGRDLHEGVLVFELQVPLARDAESGFGIGAELGRPLGLGLETPPVERPETPSAGRNGTGGRRGVGGGGGGGTGGGMGRRGGMGGPPSGDWRGERPERAKPFKLWATIQLAQPQGTHGP